MPGPTPANGAPAAVGAQSGAARNDFSDPLAAPSANSTAARPDPFANYFSLIPAAQIGTMAWHPPIFPTANPFSPDNLPASAWLTTPPIFPNSLGQFPSAATAPLSVPRIDPTRSPLGAIPNLQTTNPAMPAFPSLLRSGIDSDYGDLSTPQSLLQILSSLRSMTSVWMGVSTLKAEIEAANIALTGDKAIARSMHGWLGLSPFAKEKSRVAS